MKIESKPVYIADDGKEFFSEAECKQYEAEQAKTTYWRITHGPDLTEGRGHYGLTFVTFPYQGYVGAEDYMLDFCFKRFGPKVEFVQGASEIRNWSFERVQRADFERNDSETYIGSTRSAAKKFKLRFGTDHRLEVAEEIK